MKFKNLRKIRQYQNWCCSELLFHNLKSQLCLICPYKRLPLHTICHWGHNRTEVWNKPSVKRSKPMKTTNFSNGSRSWPILNSRHFGFINLYPITRNNIPQE
ncbi:hypothetical protein HanPSC8_Chr15g0654551 [Helianthus annuus]|nr:hypothetical protein HanPSC8_Chr15g0654551 [Helianthus annuus]